MTGGLDAALAHTKPASPPRERVLGRAAEALLIALACSSTPADRTACLYEAYDQTRVRRIAERLEWHYMPKHGSWLNMAEIEFATLSNQCLGRRIGSMSWLNCEFAGWEKERNERMVGVNRRFDTADARIELRSLYPSIKE